MSLLSDLGTKVGAEFKSHRLRIEDLEAIDHLTDGGTIDGDVSITGKISALDLITAENGIRVGTGTHLSQGKAVITFGEGPVTGDSMYITYDGENFGGDNNRLSLGSKKDGIGDLIQCEYGGNVKIYGSSVTVNGSNVLTSSSTINANTISDWKLTDIIPTHSGSDFANGTLVKTNIPATSTSGASFVIEITGKGYGEKAVNIIAEGYLYNDTIINADGINLGGGNFNYIKMMEFEGNLCFWWPRQAYWQSFAVHVRDAVGSYKNRVTSIGNSTEPSSTKKIQVDLAKTWNSHNDGNGSGLDADKLDGLESTQFLRNDSNSTLNGNLNVVGNIIGGTDDSQSTAGQFKIYQTNDTLGSGDGGAKTIISNIQGSTHEHIALGDVGPGTVANDLFAIRNSIDSGTNWHTQFKIEGNGDTFATGKIYEEGTKLSDRYASKNMGINTQATAPTSPTTGTFWFDTTTNRLKVYVNSMWLTINAVGYDILGDNSMLAYYKMMNNANDETGMFNGTEKVGAPVYAYDTTKNFYYAEFTYATQNWISLPVELLDNRSNFTMSFWVKPTGKIQDSGVGGWSNLGVSAETHLNLNTPEDLSSATVSFGEITTDAQGNINTGVSPQNITIDWHHVVGTYDGTTVKLYVDGNHLSSGSAGSGTVRVEAGLGIGRTSGDANEFSSGKFAEVMFFNRALSASEVSLLFKRH